MNEHAKLWARVLRSDEFKQGQRRLRPAEDKYCCLGVACELYRRETGDGEWVVVEDGWEFAVTDEMGSSAGTLPPLVQNWLGLRDTDGRPASGDSLAELNDNDHSFAEIADVIESEPEGLFR